MKKIERHFTARNNPIHSQFNEIIDVVNELIDVQSSKEHLIKPTVLNVYEDRIEFSKEWVKCGAELEEKSGESYLCHGVLLPCERPITVFDEYKRELKGLHEKYWKCSQCNREIK